MTRTTLKKYWSLFWLFRKMHLMRTFEYRSNFYFWGFVSMLWTVFNFFFISIIANVGNGIAGWSPMEMNLLLAVFTMLDAFTWSFFYHNMHSYTTFIFTGELNNYLAKPVDTQFLIMTHSNNYTNIFRFLIGVGMLVWSLQQLGWPVTLLGLLLFIIFFFFSLILIYFTWFILSTLAFWVDKLENINEIIPSLRRLWQVPRDVYTGFFSLLVTLIFPLGLASSIPSEALLNKPMGWWGIYFILITLFLVLFSRWFFTLSVKKYTGTAN